MFDRIAHRYDFLNRVLSMGIDVSWRKKMANSLPPRPNLRLLDLATGTADVPLTLCEQNSDIIEFIGSDLSEGMLEYGRQKVSKASKEGLICLKTGDAMQIEEPDQSFDAVSISFGIRNVPDVSQTLKEMYRVLKSDSCALILEFSTPTLPGFQQGYLFYLRHVLPRIGQTLSGDSYAYRYLNQTIETFPYGQNFCDLMIEVGFQDVEAIPLSGGIATLYRGWRY